MLERFDLSVLRVREVLNDLNFVETLEREFESFSSEAFQHLLTKVAIESGRLFDHINGRFDHNFRKLGSFRSGLNNLLAKLDIVGIDINVIAHGLFLTSDVERERAVVEITLKKPFEARQQLLGCRFREMRIENLRHHCGKVW